MTNCGGAVNERMRKRFPSGRRGGRTGAEAGERAETAPEKGRAGRGSVLPGDFQTKKGARLSIRQTRPGVADKCGVQGGTIRCSIIRASLTVALMVSLSSQTSRCALTARSPWICSRLRVALGLRPSSPQGCRFPAVPKALCRSIFRERCGRPKGAGNAAFCNTGGRRSEPGTAGLFSMRATEPLREIRRAAALRGKAGVPAPFDWETVLRMSVGEPCALRDQPCLAGAIFP